jgi:hypothetical protein
MHANIDADHGLTAVALMIRRFHLRDHQATPKQIILTLHLVMRNTLFKFDDAFWEQLVSTAMGCPPAPMHANICFAHHERERVLTKHAKHLAFYKRCINDMLGAWCCPNEAEDVEGISLSCSGSPFRSTMQLFTCC